MNFYSTIFLALLFLSIESALHPEAKLPFSIIANTSDTLLSRIRL